MNGIKSRRDFKTERERAAKQREEAAKQAREAQRAAGINVRSAGSPSGSPVPAKSMRATMEAVARQHFGSAA